MRCPNCGIDNPPSITACQCGYSLGTGETDLKKSLAEQAQDIRHESLEHVRSVVSEGEALDKFQSDAAGWKDLIKELTEVFCAWIGFHLRCPKCSRRHSNKTERCRCGFVYTEAQLANLINLSTATATRDTKIDLDDPRDIVLKCVEATGAAHTYCACEIVRDPTSEREYSGKWRLDFVRPDRFHVSSEMWDSDEQLFDEWVIEGDQHYRRSGLWHQVNDAEWTEGDVRMSRSLLVDTFLNTLRTQEFVSAKCYRYEGRQYLLLTYENIDSDDLTDEEQGLEWRIWVALDTLLLAKGETSFEGQTPEGDEIQGEIQRAYTAYNEKIEIRPPTRFHTPDAKGNFKIKYTEVEIIPHHP